MLMTHSKTPLVCTTVGDRTAQRRPRNGTPGNGSRQRAETNPGNGHSFHLPPHEDRRPTDRTPLTCASTGG
ncbi:hypothetical protein EES43_27810 [Streptomyces sp. ADI96-02]|nr:hypothetical protein EES43_27810 [Streptomyces sp. ADI96-02]